MSTNCQPLLPAQIDVVKIDCMVSDHNGLYTDDFTTFASTMQRYNITISVSPGSSARTCSQHGACCPSIPAHPLMSSAGC